MSEEVIRFSYVLEKVNEMDKKAETIEPMTWPADTNPKQVAVDILKELGIAIAGVLEANFELDVTPYEQ